MIENSATYPDAVVRVFEQHIWNVMQFIHGSKPNDAPHETQYALRKALKQWIPDEALISSAALASRDFYIDLADLWDIIETHFQNFDIGGYKPLLVRIGSPEIYKHRPLFCVPLFHELGHFIDHRHNIVETSLLLNPPGQCPPGATPEQWRFLNQRHRMEHFADLFAASYCGEISAKSLIAIAPDNGDSLTHPATRKRAAVIEDFLSGKQNHMIDLLQNATRTRTGNILEKRFEIPDAKASFDSVLTYKFKNEAEIFGIFIVGWEYLFENVENRSAPWIDDSVDSLIIEGTINDLVEKSLRNYEIVERWNNVIAN